MENKLQTTLEYAGYIASSKLMAIANLFQNQDQPGDFPMRALHKKNCEGIYYLLKSVSDEVAAISYLTSKIASPGDLASKVDLSGEATRDLFALRYLYELDARSKHKLSRCGESTE